MLHRASCKLFLSNTPKICAFLFVIKVESFVTNNVLLDPDYSRRPWTCKLFAEFAGATGALSELSALHSMTWARSEVGSCTAGGIEILCQRCVLTSGCRLRNRRICQRCVHSRHGHADATDDPMQMQLNFVRGIKCA